MGPSPPQLDPVNVAIALAALLFNASTASLIGPYAVIFIGAMLGGTWSASGRPAGDRFGTFKYLLWMVSLAMLITVPTAELLAANLPSSWNVSSRALLGIVAALITGLGPDWVISLVRSAIERWARGSGSSNEPPPPPGGPT
jgi:hypothetical protein